MFGIGAVRMAVAAVALALVPSLAGAAALDPDSCAKLKTEQDAMEKAGLKDVLAKGADWAKTNLPVEKIGEIKRWIEVDEQLLFRCPGRHLVNLPLEPDPPPPPQAEDKKGEAEKAGTPAATPRPAEKKTATPEKKPPPQRKAPANKANSTSGNSEEPEPKASPRVKATAKQKSKDDAFKPPAGDSSNPFGVN